VKPGSRRPGIACIDSTPVIAVRERAVDGRANEAVVVAIAEWLGIARSHVTIEHGTRGRSKRIAIDGLDERTLQNAIARLSSQNGSNSY
jgi:uncharacterized protein YggU (UPF0235/DUF167 family)